MKVPSVTDVENIVRVFKMILYSNHTTQDIKEKFMSSGLTESFISLAPHMVQRLRIAQAINETKSIDQTTIMTKLFSTLDLPQNDPILHGAVRRTMDTLLEDGWVTKDAILKTSLIEIINQFQDAMDNFTVDPQSE